MLPRSILVHSRFESVLGKQRETAAELVNNGRSPVSKRGSQNKLLVENRSSTCENAGFGVPIGDEMSVTWPSAARFLSEIARLAMAPPPIYSPQLYDLERPLFTIEQIRQTNPQRFEMEQITSILYVDNKEHGLVGLKEITDKEFWVRGHMPDFPLMPGVVLCEVAAQLAGFYARKYELLSGDFLGFGGMEQVRFRCPVWVGDRLVVQAKLTKLRARRAEFNFQGYVGDRLVYHGTLLGVPIQKDRAAAELGSE